jgi:imidazolonepropionase-like amidohydrolase
MLHVDFAGSIITAVGGYPSDREWADPRSYLEISTPDDARVAVEDMHGFGATRIKIALNTDAGPVLDDATLSATIARARELGMVVIVHVEGSGQAERAFRAGADSLAHTPFTERLDDALIGSMAAQMSWTSTLDIHGYGERSPGFETAIHNLRRFVAAGGAVLYGTDLGNGPLPLGINVRELAALVEAGMTSEQLIASLAGPRSDCDRWSWVSDPDALDPRSPSLQWLAGSRVLSAATVRGNLR